MKQVKRMPQVIWWVRAMLILRGENGAFIVESRCRRNNVMSYRNCSNIEQDRLRPLLFIIQLKRIDHILAAVLFHLLAATRTLVFCVEWIEGYGRQFAATIMSRYRHTDSGYQV